MMIDTQTAWAIVGLAVVALAIVAGLLVARRARKRTAMLRERFGPEYGRAVNQFGGERAGERELAARVKRVDQIHVRELTAGERMQFTSRWSSIQTQFVDDPRSAVALANDLIKEVMAARGYSAHDAFERRVADLSVDHPDVVQHYRAAHELARLGTPQAMNTEDLRQAMVHYRVLFADLLQPTPPAATGTLVPAHA